MHKDTFQKGSLLYLGIAKGQVFLQIECQIKAAISRSLTGRHRRHKRVDIVVERKVLLAAAPAHCKLDLGAVDLGPGGRLAGCPIDAMYVSLTGQGCAPIAEGAGHLLIQTVPLQQTKKTVRLALMAALIP